MKPQIVVLNVCFILLGLRCTDGSSYVRFWLFCQQSSTDVGGECQYSIDEDDTTSSRTQQEDNPWLLLDLGSTNKVEAVDLRNGDVINLTDLQVLVGNSLGTVTDSALCATSGSAVAPSQSVRMICDSAVLGRYVVVRVAADARRLVIARLNVYGGYQLLLPSFLCNQTGVYKEDPRLRCGQALDQRTDTKTHTIEAQNVWWTVALPSAQNLDYVEIINIFSAYHFRLANFEIRFGFDANFSQNKLCFYFSGKVGSGIRQRFTCNSQLTGTVLSVQLLADHSLEMVYLTAYSLERGRRISSSEDTCLQSSVYLSNFSLANCYNALDSFFPANVNAGGCFAADTEAVSWFVLVLAHANNVDVLEFMTSSGQPDSIKSMEVRVGFNSTVFLENRFCAQWDRNVSSLTFYSIWCQETLLGNIIFLQRTNPNGYFTFCDLSVYQVKDAEAPPKQPRCRDVTGGVTSSGKPASMEFNQNVTSGESDVLLPRGAFECAAVTVRVLVSGSPDTRARYHLCRLVALTSTECRFRCKCPHDTCQVYVK